MSKIQLLKTYLNERLIAAAEEIFGVVEQTISEYQDEIVRSKEEICRLRGQLGLYKKDPQSGRAIDIQHHQQPKSISPAEEDDPEQQHCGRRGNTSRPIERVDMGPSHVKEEHQKAQRDLWMGGHDDEEQLEGLESDIKEFISTPTCLKNALQEDPALPFHLYQANTEENKEKPYCCSVCEKRFSNCSHLVAHIRTHTGERPYRCDICRKTFITTSALNRHQTIHTEGKQFICNYCGKCFKWMESLGRHMRSVHKRVNMPI